MTERELRKLVAVWARRLGLGHFNIAVEVCNFDPATHCADSSPPSDYDTAKVRFQPWVLDGKPPTELEFLAFDVETVVVHELLHVAVRPMRRACTLLSETNSLHRDVEAMWVEAWSQREEETVDRLAVALVKAWKRP